MDKQAAGGSWSWTDYLPSPGRYIFGDKAYQGYDAAEQQLQQSLAARSHSAENYQKAFQQNNRDALKLLGLGALSAAAFRAVRELGSIHGSPVDRAPRIGPTVLDLPTPVLRKKKKKEPKEEMQKAAEEPYREFNWTDLGALGAPVLVGGAMTGLYGGYKLTDAVLDWHRRRQKDQELEKAKKRFQEATIAQYIGSPALTTTAAEIVFPKEAQEKQAALEEALDQAFDSLETWRVGFEKAGMMKQAEGTNYLGLASGLGTTALLAGLPLVAMLGYQQGKKSTNKSILQEALKRRQARQWDQQPFEIYARPLPVEIDAEEEDSSAALPSFF